MPDTSDTPGVTPAEARELGQKARIGQVRLATEGVEDINGLWWTDTHVWERITAGPAPTEVTPQFDIKVTPDLGWAGSTAMVGGDGQFVFAIPEDMDGMVLSNVSAYITTTSSSGVPEIQIANLTAAVDMLSTPITIDVGDLDSKDATTAPVIDTGADDVAWGDQISIDIDVAGTGVFGLGVILDFS